MARYATGSHTKHRLQYHLVWIPKYRKRILQGKIGIRLKKLMYEACRMNGWWISEIAIREDHLHILLDADVCWFPKPLYGHFYLHRLRNQKTGYRCWVFRQNSHSYCSF